MYDRVLTLSTCTGNGHATRWVVQAVLKGVAPSDAARETPVEPEEQAGEPVQSEEASVLEPETAGETPVESIPEDGGEAEGSPA